MALILSDYSFDQPQMLRARYLLYPGWSVLPSCSVFHSDGCYPPPRVHKQPFGCWVRGWRWLSPRLPPRTLSATLLQLLGYRLLIAVKPPFPRSILCFLTSCLLAAQWRAVGHPVAVAAEGSPSCRSGSRSSPAFFVCVLLLTLPLLFGQDTLES